MMVRYADTVTKQKYKRPYAISDTPTEGSSDGGGIMGLGG